MIYLREAKYIFVWKFTLLQVYFLKVPEQCRRIVIVWKSRFLKNSLKKTTNLYHQPWNLKMIYEIEEKILQVLSFVWNPYLKMVEICTSRITKISKTKHGMIMDSLFTWENYAIVRLINVPTPFMLYIDGTHHYSWTLFITRWFVQSTNTNRIENKLFLMNCERRVKEISFKSTFVYFISCTLPAELTSTRCAVLSNLWTIGVLEE